MKNNFVLPKTEEKWKRALSPEQYKIMREKGTEPPFSGKLLYEKGRGAYRCAACGNPLFSSDAKFESGTGWPSFDRALPGAVKLRPDKSEGTERTEAICKRCGSHLGHVFDDLPAPRRVFSVYVIRCENGSFYVGHTDNLFRRWQEHKQGKVDWTKKYKPIEVVHYENFETRDDAVKREKSLKTGFGRKWLKDRYERKALNKWNEEAARQAGGPEEKGGKRYCLNSVCLGFEKKRE